MKRINILGGSASLFVSLVLFSHNLYAAEISNELKNKEIVPIREDIFKVCGYVQPGVNPVMADNPEIFSVFAKEKPKELAKRNFFDSKGSWYSCLFFMDRTSDIGQVLYNNLPADFLFSDKKSENSARFPIIFPPSATVTFLKKGFEVQSGQQKYHVERIAVLDWNHNGKNEWLLYVRSSRLNTPKLWRDYFVLLDNLGTPSPTASNLLIREYNNGTISHLTSVMHGLLQESICQEFDAGETQILDSSKNTVKPDSPSMERKSLPD